MLLETLELKMRLPVYVTLLTAVVFLLDRAYARRSEFRREIDLKKLEKVAPSLHVNAFNFRISLISPLPPGL